MRILKEEKLISPEGIREVFMGEVTLNISIVRNGAKRFLAEGIKARVEKIKHWENVEHFQGVFGSSFV